jgi:hypothetical protein
MSPCCDSSSSRHDAAWSSRITPAPDDREDLEIQRFAPSEASPDTGSVSLRLKAALAVNEVRVVEVADRGLARRPESTNQSGT